MTRPTDPRGANRRGSTDSSDLGYTAANHATPHTGKRWPAPGDIYGISRYMRQRANTGRCVVCGSPTDAPGLTCKSTNCLSCWILGHEEPFTVAVERMEY
jgi:hypothetical protein